MLFSCLGALSPPNCLLETVPLSLASSANCRRYHSTALQTVREFCQETSPLTWLSLSSEKHFPFQLQFRRQLLPAPWIMLALTSDREVTNWQVSASFSHFPLPVAEVHSEGFTESSNTAAGCLPRRSCKRRKYFIVSACVA